MSKSQVKSWNKKTPSEERQSAEERSRQNKECLKRGQIQPVLQQQKLLRKKRRRQLGDRCTNFMSWLGLYPALKCTNTPPNASQKRGLQLTGNDFCFFIFPCEYTCSLDERMWYYIHFLVMPAVWHILKMSGCRLNILVQTEASLTKNSWMCSHWPQEHDKTIC